MSRANYIVDISKQPYGICITTDGGYEYQIHPVTSFGDCIMGNISDWVHQVMGKTWSDTHSLYKLGAMLSSRTKDSQISWEDTFLMVEKRDYIEKELERRKKAEAASVNTGTAQKDSVFDSLMYRIDLGQELTNDEVHAEITKTVAEKLKSYGFKLS